MAIVCRVCGYPTTAQETRSIETYVRRRRICSRPDCGTRVTTIEIAVLNPRQLARLGELIVVPRAAVEASLRAIGHAMIACVGRDGAIALLPAEAAEGVEPAPEPVTPSE